MLFWCKSSSAKQSEESDLFCPPDSCEWRSSWWQFHRDAVRRHHGASSGPKNSSQQMQQRDHPAGQCKQGERERMRQLWRNGWMKVCEKEPAVFHSCFWCSFKFKKTVWRWTEIRVWECENEQKCCSLTQHFLNHMLLLEMAEISPSFFPLHTDPLRTHMSLIKHVVWICRYLYVSVISACLCLCIQGRCSDCEGPPRCLFSYQPVRKLSV